MNEETATQTEDGWICDKCKCDIFSGCDHYFGEWSCKDCGEWTYPFFYDIADGCQYCGGSNISKPQTMKILNLYAGLGGNRKHWSGQVTAIERQPDIAAAYAAEHPDDEVIVGDAHEYLAANFDRFDFIWASPPCQSHSKMDLANSRNSPRYPDMKLYEEIIFLQTYHRGKWVVENVVPYYEPLIRPTARIGRHLFWSNFTFQAEDVSRPKNFIASGGQASAESLKEWLGISYDGNIYYDGRHCPAQVLRNAVHPLIGAQIMAAVTGETWKSRSNQMQLL